MRYTHTAMQRANVLHLLSLGLQATTARERRDFVALADLNTSLDDMRIAIRLAAGVAP